MPYTLDQLEAFVSSAHYDAATAGLIALGIPALKAATGAPGELLEPGVRRIRGNLCNVHGRYGPCDKALSGKKKPAKGRKPPKGRAARQTPAQRAQARTQQREANIADVAKRMADTDTGLSPTGARAMAAFAQGQQPDAATGEQLAKMGLAERASDGSYRMTSTGRAAVNAMAAGDYQRAVDAISRASDSAGKRTARQTAQQERAANATKRQQDAAGKRVTRQVARELAARQRAEQAKKKPKKVSAGGSKKPEKEPTEKPRKPAKRVARSQAPAGPSSSGIAGSAPKPKKTPAPKKTPKQITPALQAVADKLSEGAELSEEDTQALIRNGLAKLNKDGQLVLTAAGMRATQKEVRAAVSGIGISDNPANPSHSLSTLIEPARALSRTGAARNPSIPSFRVFKDAQGRHRWVAQSSTAFQDRDREIVSTKALSDDCAFADQTGEYGPLRWWHTPGLDLGDCDFNAMHGRVLIESGTFKSERIAMKVARAAEGLEISLGFIHLPTEPDADGVFHHIRRFERSLVPRGKASNRFTAFAVKETRMFDPTKIAALKTLGFGDDDIAALQAQAAATEKSATDQGVAFKADEPIPPPPAIQWDGSAWVLVGEKALPPQAEVVEEVIEEDAVDPMIEEEVVDDAAMTLSQGDLSAIGEAVGAALQAGIAQIMGALDLEKKVAGHVQGLLAPFQQAQTTKDAALAETREQLETVKAQLAELTGDQPATAYRPSAAADNVLTDATMLAAAKQLADPHGSDPWADIKQGLGIARTQ